MKADLFCTHTRKEVWLQIIVFSFGLAAVLFLIPHQAKNISSSLFLLEILSLKTDFVFFFAGF